MTLQTGRLERPDLPLHYESWGRPGRVAPVVFIHGWAGSSQDWRKLRPELPPDRLYLAADCAGFGDSQFPAGAQLNPTSFSLSRYTEDLRVLLDEAGFEKVALVGHSWGGVVGMEFAARYPERVESLVVIGSAYFDPSNPLHQLLKWVSYLIGWLVVLLKKPLQKWPRLRRGAVRRYFRHQPDPATLDELVAEVVRGDNRAIIQTLLAGYTVRFKTICPQLKCPTLYLGCWQDVVAPPAFVEAFVPFTPQGKYELMEDCGHFPMLEKPAELAERLVKFWAKASGGKGQA